MDSEASKLRNEIRRLVGSHDGILQFHGFYVDLEKKRISFDIIIDFDVDRRALYEHIFNEISEKYPDYEIRITLDTDVSD